MQEKIYTIQIWDAFNNANECPFCYIKKEVEKQYLKTVIDELVMDYHFHDRIVEYAFCTEHLNMFYKKSDKLGFATLLEKMIGLEIKNMHKINKFNISRDSIRKRKCYLCERIEKSIEKSIDSTISLWLENEKFHSLYKKNGTFCQPHFFDLINKGKKIKSFIKKKKFLIITYETHNERIDLIEKNLKEYIKKFDFNYKNEDIKIDKEILIESINIVKND